MRWLLLTAVILWSATASAQELTEAQQAEASARFRRGVELYHEGAFRAALAEFQRVYAMAPDYRLLYNIAQAKLEVQDFLGAAQDYERYLVEGGDEIEASARQQVEEVLVELRERVGRISITVNREGAEVLIDDAKVGVAPITGTVLANVGRHRISARTKDGASDATVIDLAGGEVLEVSLTLTEPVRVAAVAPERRWTLMRRTGFGSWIAGGALLATGVVTGVLTNSSKDELDELLTTPDVNRKAVADKKTSTDNLALTTDIMLATGAALAVAGTFMWIFGGTEEVEPTKRAVKGAQVDWSVGLGSAQVRTRF